MRVGGSDHGYKTRKGTFCRDEASDCPHAGQQLPCSFFYTTTVGQHNHNIQQQQQKKDANQIQVCLTRPVLSLSFLSSCSC